MPVQPPAPRHTSEEIGGRLIISVPNLRLWPVISILSAWILVWVGLGISIFAESNAASVLPFAVIWVGVGILLVCMLIWHLAGKEEIQITSESITISRVIFGIRFP